MEQGSGSREGVGEGQEVTDYSEQREGSDNSTIIVDGVAKNDRRMTVEVVSPEDEKIDKTDVPELAAGMWTEWTECSQGFKNRTKCDDWEDCTEVELCRPEYGCVTEVSSSCTVHREDINSWSEWSVCSTYTQERIRCEPDMGCEVEERPCDRTPDSTWSEWGPCVEGTQVRNTCRDGVVLGCETEEKVCEAEAVGTWSEWSDCVDGTQERLLCEEGFECEIEERHCGLASEASWSEWGPCIAGIQERTTCGDIFWCEHEGRPCGDSQTQDGLHEWSEWGSCVGGCRERLRCEEELSCEVEEEGCGNAGNQYSDRSPCERVLEKLIDQWALFKDGAALDSLSEVNQIRTVLVV